MNLFGICYTGSTSGTNLRKIELPTGKIRKTNRNQNRSGIAFGRAAFFCSDLHIPTMSSNKVFIRRKYVSLVGKFENVPA